MAKDVLDPFMDSYRANFSGIKKTPTRQARIFEMASSEDAPKMFNQTIPLPKDKDLLVPNQTQQADQSCWTWAVTMHKLIIGAPGCFFAEPITGPRTCPGLPDEAKEPLVNRHSAEDWSRAYWLIKTKIRQASRTDGQEGAGRTQNKDPLEPLALTIDQEANRGTEAHPLNRTQLGAASTAPLPSRDNNAALEHAYDFMVGAGLPDNLIEATNPKAQGEGYDAFEKMMDKNRPATAGNLQKKYDRLHARPALTIAAQADLCTKLGKSVTILYPLIDDEHPLVPTTQQVEQVTDDFLSAHNPASTLSERILRHQHEQMLKHDATEQTLADEGGDQNPNVDDFRKSYIDLQAQLNAVSTTLPTFVDTCATLGMDPSRPILEPIPTAIPTNAPAATVRTLKPWQVQFLA